MTTIRQLVAAAAPGDAVTGQALAWAGLLREWGHECEIVAEHVHPEMVGRVRRLATADPAGIGGTPVILHYSIWSEVVPIALATPGPLAVCYHNVTPGELLRPWNPGLADACDRARRALPGLARADVLIADSAFNAVELERAGARGAGIVPLLLDMPAPPAAPDARAGAPMVLSVGRIVPNKRLEDVLKAFTLYQRHRAPDASLVLVGTDSGFEAYGRALRRLIERLGVRGVTLTGRVSDAERDDLYERADAYLCMSVHEGFCAPLVEAMAGGVPIVARRAGAVPETVGGAGIVVDGDLALVAEALHEVVTTPATRLALRVGAARRLAELEPSLVAARLRAALGPILEER